MPKEMEEGWGLTHDGTFLYASDGTNRIFKINANDFSVVDIIEVKDKHGKAIHYINELELVGDYIYGNVLPLNVVIKVNKDTGIIEKVYDFKKLHDIQMQFVGENRLQWDSSNNVMNGIAYRKSTNSFLITGKEYNFIFEVKLN
jgi:glutaminyl-peptide cyclotransferase